jgi:hypothetical protein
MYQVARRVHIVVLYKSYPTLELTVRGQVVHLLEEVFRLGIGRMGLAGEYYLNWSRLVINDFLEAFDVLENQRWPFIFSKAAHT